MKVSVPVGGLTLRLSARNDDAGTHPKISIRVNGKAIFEAASEYGSDDFSTRAFAIPAAVLKSGENVLSIRNLEINTAVGTPPWFMVDRAELLSVN